MSQVSLSRDADDDKLRNTNMEIKSRYKQLQKKCRAHEDEIKQLKETVRHMTEQVAFEF